jgi:hypothetical protein
MTPPDRNPYANDRGHIAELEMPHTAAPATLVSSSKPSKPSRRPVQTPTMLEPVRKAG